MPDRSPFSDARVVLFDVGNTLLDASTLRNIALREAAEYLYQRGLVADPEMFCKAYTKVDRTIEGPSVNHLYSGLEIARRAWVATGLRQTPRSLGAFLAVYRQSVRRGIRRKGNLIRLFRSLHDRGYRIGVLSDGTAVEQMEQLFRLGLIEYVDALVTSEEVGVEKPHPRIYEEALSRLHAKPNETVMVGDDIWRDIAGAQKLGLLAILVTEYSEQGGRCRSVRPDATIETVLELAKMFIEDRHDR